ncbi:hypothetical protein [Rhodoferax sp.]|uniref:hypothetical protein n=1 Tax=Rhodoferax sp. TaxID=50421 RepID=UPI00260D671A|nr:hypothetical protein [Rhodoferax sp.]MDD2919007.1 hypothetical protein [Rhodoferax sp.]
MNNVVKNIIFFFLGAGLTSLVLLYISDDGVLITLENINNRYASIIGVVFSVVLVIVTLIYVILTFFQVNASNKSVEVSQNLLKQTEKQLMFSNVPTLIPDITETSGSAYFGEKRRQLGIKAIVKNIGDSPALHVHTRIKLIYKHVEYEWKDQLYEYSFIGNLSAQEEKKSDMHFETRKIEKMMEDFSISHAKNVYRVKNNPAQSSYRGPDLSIEVIYSNVHGQYFKSHLIHPILAIEAPEREEKEKGYVYMHDDEHIKDDERFKLALINPIFQEFLFEPISNEEANSLIEKYRSLV